MHGRSVPPAPRGARERAPSPEAGEGWVGGLNPRPLVRFLPCSVTQHRQLFAQPSCSNVRRTGMLRRRPTSSEAVMNDIEQVVVSLQDFIHK